MRDSLAQQGKYEAIATLATYWHNHPENLPIIKRMAQWGEYKAIAILSIYWPNDP